MLRLATYIQTFYLPGLAPVSFCKKDKPGADKCLVRSFQYFDTDILHIYNILMHFPFFLIGNL